jgi:hypothetical protein
MYKNATKCNETIGKWCKTKHGASKIIDTFETYHGAAGGDLRQGMAVGLAVMAVVGRHIVVDGRRRWPWRSSAAAGYSGLVWA